MKELKGLEKILEEFDKEFVFIQIEKDGSIFTDLVANLSIPYLKSFISSVYQQGKEDTKEEVETWAENELKRNEKAPCKNEHRKPILGEVADRYSCAQLHIGYEECLSDLLSYLKKMR